MSPLQTFRHFTICQDSHGATVEVWRGADEVACLAFDNNQRCFVELHVSIGPAERSRDSASFQNLVNLATPLRHHHLLGIIEGGEDEGSNYFITSFLDGERLDAWLARNHPLPPWLALLIIRQLVEGLAALSSHPRLLAGVEVFHAGLTMTGPHPEDLTVKICDLGLAGAAPPNIEPQLVEARAIRETGRLLLYMLTGSLAEGPVTPHHLVESPFPQELGFLLNTIFQTAQPHHPRTLQQLLTLTERCLEELPAGYTAQPDLLPSAYRPRLPLSQHLPDGAATAETLRNDYTLDTRPPDASDPYRYRGTERSTRRPVNIQLLPPPNLIPTAFLQPAVEKAWTTFAGQRVPQLLAPLAWHPETPAPLLVEEFPGKYNLDTLRRLRAPLTPAEVYFILTQIDQAATAAASLDLSLHWGSPRLIPVHFTDPGGAEALPPPAQLSRLPLTEWPAFTLKLRTWPITLDFTQPERFQLERLLPRDPALGGEAFYSTHSPAAGPPATRDFALLALWLLGGSPQLKENLKPVLYAAISARGPAPDSRQEFLSRFQKASTIPPSAPLPPVKLKSKARGTTARVPTPITISPAASPMQPTPIAAGFPVGPFEDAEPEAELPAMGFAEALFGTTDQSSPPNSGYSTLWPASPAEDGPDYLPYPSDYNPDAPPEGTPPGFMEAASQSTAWHPDDQSGDTHYPGYQGGSRWMLFLVVILIAAALAALMAQLSGQAIWLK